MIHLKGHTALITASTGGIGLSIAKSMAEAGANVVLNGRSLNEQAQAALATCRSFGVRASFVAADLLGPTEAGPMLSDDYNPLDLLDVEAHETLRRTILETTPAAILLHG